MSIQVTREVWARFREGGTPKLIMLAFADWADNMGGRIFPSIRALAEKVCCSESQARRSLHVLIDRGFVEVVGNHGGGKPGTTRHYRIVIERLTGSADATPTGSACRLPAMRGNAGC